MSGRRQLLSTGVKVWWLLKLMVCIHVAVLTAVSAASSVAQQQQQQPMMDDTHHTAGIVADEVHIEYHPGAAAIGSFGDWSRDWSVLSGTVGGRLNQARCVDIPTNMSLCRGIGYHQMRLPNLLDHDSITETTQQASSWVPLLNIRCHSDTQMFLCSLFAPVCLDRPIWPCRTLCRAVQQGCESRMIKYGFPWPEMLRCDKFPLDNDLCIGLHTSQAPDEDKICAACDQPDTFEGVVDHFCNTEFALRVKSTQILVAGADLKIITSRKKKVFKAEGLTKKELRGETIFYVENGAQCQCNMLDTDRTVSSSSPSKQHQHSSGSGLDDGATYLVMGQRKNPGDRLVVTFIQSLRRRSRGVARAMTAMRQKTVCKTGLAAAVAPSAPYRATPLPANSKNGNEKKKTKMTVGTTATTTTTTTTIAPSATRAGNSRNSKGGEGGKKGRDGKISRDKQQVSVTATDGKRRPGNGHGKGNNKRRRSDSRVTRVTLM